jgi:hypothetical protein
MHTVCKGGGGYGVLGLRQINTCRKVSLQVNFLDAEILHCLLYESYFFTVQRLAGGFIPLLGNHLVHSSQHNEVNTIKKPSLKRSKMNVKFLLASLKTPTVLILKIVSKAASPAFLVSHRSIFS